MDLIIGGIYQGKLDYAKNHFGIADEDVYECRDTAGVETHKRCIRGLEQYMRFCLQEGIAPFLDFRQDAVILCQDIFCGVVPVDEETRAWRELTGRTVTELAARCDTVTRMFCGLPQRLK